MKRVVVLLIPIVSPWRSIGAIRGFLPTDGAGLSQTAGEPARSLR